MRLSIKCSTIARKADMSFSKPFQKKVDLILDLISLVDKFDRSRLSPQLAFNDKNEKQLIVILGNDLHGVYKSNFRHSVNELTLEVVVEYHKKILDFLSDPEFKFNNKNTNTEYIKRAKELFLQSTKEISGSAVK